MSYKVDFDSLDSLYNAVGNQANNWISELEAVKGKLQILLDTSDMSGAAADSIKSYIENVHITLIALLTQLVSLHSSNCLLYKSDYQTKVDTGLHSVIKSTELSDFKGRIDTTKATAISIDESISYVLNGIKDIFYISYADVSKVDAQHLSVSNFLSDLDTEINTLENTHYDNDFVNTTRLINALRAFINEQTETSRTYKTNFKIEYLASSSSFLQLYDSHVDVTEEIESKSSAINAAIENENQRVADLQKEYEERQEKATIIKWIVTGVCIVGSIAAIAATGGAATPLVVGTVSAISGAVMAGTNNLTDQYVQHGNLIENSNQIDWEKFGQDVVVGGVSGFVTGYVGASVGGILTNGLSRTRIGSTLLNSSTGIVRFGTGAVIGSASEVGSGIVSRGVGSYIMSSGDVNAAVDAAFDLNQIAFDATIGGVTGGYSAAKNPVGRKITIDDLDKELLQTKPKYSPAPKRWLEEVGGEIYVDANGTWTYQAPDGVHVCYNDGHPNFQRAGLGEEKANIGRFSEKRYDDFKIANSTHTKSPTSTWHHCEDGKTLLAVDTKYHKLFTHRGGFSIVNRK